MRKLWRVQSAFTSSMLQHKVFNYKRALGAAMVRHREQAPTAAEAAAVDELRALSPVFERFFAQHTPWQTAAKRLGGLHRAPLRHDGCEMWRGRHEAPAPCCVAACTDAERGEAEAVWPPVGRLSSREASSSGSTGHAGAITQQAVAAAPEGAGDECHEAASCLEGAEPRLQNGQPARAAWRLWGHAQSSGHERNERRVSAEFSRRSEYM